MPFISGSWSCVFSCQNIIDSYDKDKDGQLDYTEFLGYMMDRERKWKIHFHDLDKNKCGERLWPENILNTNTIHYILHRYTSFPTCSYLFSTKTDRNVIINLLFKVTKPATIIRLFVVNCSRPKLWPLPSYHLQYHIPETLDYSALLPMS